MMQNRKIVNPLVLGAMLLAGPALAMPQDLAIDVQVFDDVKSCDDDGVLDVGEVGRVVVAVRNLTDRPFSDAMVVVKPDAGLQLGWYQVRLPKIGAYEIAVAEFQAELKEGHSGQIQMRVLVTPPANDQIAPRAVTADFLMNIDAAQGVSRIDDVEFMPSAWRPRFDDLHGKGSGWARGLDENSNHVWFVTGSNSGAHASIESPVLKPAHNKDFVISFQHRYEFTGPGVSGLAGGVVELSDDGGQSWMDISSLAQIPYDGKLNGGGGALEGREAFVGRNPSLPGRDVVVLNLGNVYQGDSVQVRFRMAAGKGPRGAGWEIDNIEVQGTYNAPFGAIVPDRGFCDAGVQLSKQTIGAQVYLPDDLKGDFDGFHFGGDVEGAVDRMVTNHLVLNPSFTGPDDVQGQIEAAQVYAHSATVQKSGFGRISGGQVVAAGCSTNAGTPGALPLALGLVFFGWVGMRRRA